MQLRTRPALAGLAALALITALAAPPSAAQQQQLTPERMFGPEFRLEGLPEAHWMNDGQRYSFVQYVADGVTDLVAADARSGQTTVLVEGRSLVVPGRAAPIEIEGYEWSADERKLLIYTESQPVWRQNTKGKYYVLDLASKRLTPVSTAEGWQQFAKLSPDASKVGFVRDNDLWVADLATGRETRLTSDGSETIINGTFDWVYEEELGVQDGWRWSPDGARVAFWRIDQGPVRTFTWLNDTDSAYSRAITLRYPKAGDANPTAKIGVFDLASGRTTWIGTGDDQSVYLARMEWWGDSPTGLMVQRLNRHQNRLDVMMADARTGEARVVFTDTDSAWVEVDDDLTFIGGGRQFLWSSEKDGFNHLYLVNRDGTVARQLTRGQWDVVSVYGVDSDGLVWFTSTEEGPEERQLYSVALRGGEPRQVTREAGTHAITLSPATPYYLDSYSRAGVPPVISLHRKDGTLVRTLVENERARASLQALGVNLPEFTTIPAADGTPLAAWIIKPPAFDPNKKYPVLMYVYGGPGSQTVLDSWGGSRYLWHQLLAQRGYVVVSVDNRGTGGRGSAFRKSVYLKLGEQEAADQVAAGQWLARQPYVDASRIGIWGWSYGGYATAITMMTPGSPFKAGIAVAPVADWGLYDSIYTERFMRTPQENPGGYAKGSPVRQAANLRGELLVVHGTGDDNVHFQNSVQLADALQAAGKQFDFMLYPNRNHSIAGGRSVHLYTLMTRWITENL